MAAVPLKPRWILLALAAVPALGFLGAYTGEPWMTFTFLLALAMGLALSTLWTLSVLAGFWAPGVSDAPRVPIVVFFAALGLWLVSYPLSEELRVRLVGQEAQEVHGATVEAGLAFHRDHGRMPFALDELVPGYLKDVPQMARRDCEPVAYEPRADGHWTLIVFFGVRGVATLGGCWTRSLGPSAGGSGEQGRNSAWRLEESS